MEQTCLYMFVHDMYMFIWVKTRIYLYKHVHTRLNDVHTWLYLSMYIHVYTMYIHVYKLTEMYIHVYKFPWMYVNVWTMYKTCMYYSIVHTRLIHASDMYVHVYARWVGFQMLVCTGTSESAISVTVLKSHFKRSWSFVLNSCIVFCERRFVRTFDLQKGFSLSEAVNDGCGKGWFKFGLRRF